MKEIFTPYIFRDGRRVFASEYGLKVFHFFVTEEQDAAYQAKKAKKAKGQDN